MNYATAIRTARKCPHTSSRHGIVVQRKCARGGSALGVAGECSACRREKALRLQTKLAVGARDDSLEREADRIADTVRGSVSAAELVNAGRAAGSGLVARPVPPITTGTVRPTAGGGEAPAIVRDVVSSPGRPLDPATRAELEPRFGHDFGKVRVHTDDAAARSAHEVDAHAYTVGHHVVFGAGRYAPQNAEGRHLLAHELIHVVQQAGEANPRKVQRGSLKGPSTKPHSCGGWTCAPMGDCKNPDGKAAPSATASTSWKLTANVDTDVAKSTDINEPSEVGHAFVEFTESNGDRYTYGQYPSKLQLPSDWKPEVPGCTAHPDQTHAGCVDLRLPSRRPSTRTRSDSRRPGASLVNRTI